MVLGDGRLQAGTAKLAQRAVIELLTEPGSVRGDPTRGTVFASLTRPGRVATEADIFAAFSLSLPGLARALARGETTATPLEERYKSARLDKVVLTPGQLVLTVSVVSQAGGPALVSFSITYG
ncbi:MAG: hypothetical protein E6G97_17865 [Alphaproteobacteria bacterium]|nr:MAG: hypothetical protein E6G97_17865 [Alphaproteobacteria bacterium]